MDKTAHCLVSLDDFQQTKYSGVLFNDKYVITSSRILSPLLNKQNDKIKDCLQQFRIINFYESSNELCSRNISVVHHKLNNHIPKLEHENEKLLFKSKAKLLYLFNCQNISEEMERIFRQFTVKSVDNNAIDDELNNLLVSSFVLLTLNSMVPNSIVMLNELNVNSSIISQENLNYKTILINKLDEIVAISTPFGHENFFETVNIGRVANTFGKSNCLYVASCQLTQGEGAAVYNMQRELVGIVICSTIYSGNDNFEFTLVANFNEIFVQLSKQLLGNYNSLIKKNIDFKESIDSSVLINGKGSLGTGSFIRIKDKRFIITCAHVVRHNSSTVKCVYSKGSFTAKILFKNPNHGLPYDIAILEGLKSIPDEYFVECAKNKPEIGQLLHSIGYPLFTNFKSTKTNSCIYEGRVTNYSKGVLCTDICIQAGQSGGGIYDTNGHLVGISVLNLRYHKGVIAPRINMAVPVYDIGKSLEKFALTNDLKILSDLVITNTNSTILQKWNLETPKISKL